MNRKYFLSAASALLAAHATPVAGWARAGGIPIGASETPAIVPPYLKQGDIIGITSPAGYILPEDIRPAIQLMESWGYVIRMGKSIGKRDFTFGGTDAERADDLQQMLDDETVKAIMCARGGYGAVRLVDRLNWNLFRQKPKWIIGFSDITVLHSHISRTMGIASIHSKMCNSFPDDWSKAEPIQTETILSIKKALSGEKMQYELPPGINNRPGTARGRLVGGNLKTLESLAGSDSDIRTHDKILFVEDTGEYLYSIDRMFWNLKRSGKLSQLAALIIGGFKVKTDDSNEDFGKTVYDIVMEKVKGYTYPVCFDFPVGHQKNNFALKCGVEHTLTINNNGCILREI